MTIGVVDMSNAFGRKLALEQAAQRAIEKVMQTTAVDDRRRDDQGGSGVARQWPTRLRMQVTVTDRLECDGDVQARLRGHVCATGEDEAALPHR